MTQWQFHASVIATRAMSGSRVVPRFLDLKFSTFGHDSVVLHSHEIRKQTGAFSALTDAPLRARFHLGLNDALQFAPFTIVAAVIDKVAHRARYAAPDNPYDIALRFCMERTFALLRARNQTGGRTHITVEARGRSEDRDLELTFLRVAQGANRWGAMPFDLIFADKKANTIGLQVADLVAHPIGRHCINPGQANRAWEIVEPKIRRSPQGLTGGWGLKRFP